MQLDNIESKGVTRQQPMYNLMYQSFVAVSVFLIEVMAADKDFRVFQFPNNRTRDWVLKEGPSGRIANQIVLTFWIWRLSSPLPVFYIDLPEFKFIKVQSDLTKLLDRHYCNLVVYNGIRSLDAR
ncbi:hypothetical protein TIFTF001_000796 [Ficus carica]|uniref:Uncharacterized protein n=1 Tax=Ficus carica TaxID=3494 RepID=A0AA87YYP5_FICCA|nr:hypothetical protein TIFTF001_000796 [Ficus carica]